MIIHIAPQSSAVSPTMAASTVAIRADRYAAEAGLLHGEARRGDLIGMSGKAALRLAPPVSQGFTGELCSRDVTDPKFFAHSGPPPCSPPV